MHADARFLQSIQIRNLLSFGPDTPRLELEPLNLLIGPSGSGKSNLIDAISLLHAAPGNLLEPIQGAGGIREWLWKGNESGDASLEVTCRHPEGYQTALRHRLSFGGWVANGTAG